jgi:hypothetical protein
MFDELPDHAFGPTFDDLARRAGAPPSDDGRVFVDLDHRGLVGREAFLAAGLRALVDGELSHPRLDPDARDVDRHAAIERRLAAMGGLQGYA